MKPEDRRPVAKFDIDPKMMYRFDHDYLDYGM